MELVSSIIESVIHILAILLEIIGTLVIAHAGIMSFVKYCRYKFHEPDAHLRLELANSMALGLEFLLGSEILKTIAVRDFSELMIVGALVILRALITLLLHWEIKHQH